MAAAILQWVEGLFKSDEHAIPVLEVVAKVDLKEPWKRDGALGDHYSLAERIGVGNYADVYSASNLKCGGSVAVKIIQKSKVEDIADIKREIDILSDIQHPHILRLHEVYETPLTTCVVTELLPGGTLAESMERSRFPEHDAAAVIHQLCDALAHIHKLGYIHRDVKPENILLTHRRASASSDPPTTIKLADFGVAHRIAETDHLQEVWGTPGYLAPEVLRGEADSAAPDLWSVGVILYVLLSGERPFPYPEADPNEEYETLESGGFERVDLSTSRAWRRVSDGAKQLIRGLLDVDAQQRLTAEQVLEHGWNPTSLASHTATSRAWLRVPQRDDVLRWGPIVGLLGARSAMRRVVSKPRVVGRAKSKQPVGASKATSSDGDDGCGRSPLRALSGANSSHHEQMEVRGSLHQPQAGAQQPRRV